MLALSWGKVDNDDSETRINGPVRGLSRRTACSGRAVAHNRTPIRATRHKAAVVGGGSGQGDGDSSKEEKENPVLLSPACQPRTKPSPHGPPPLRSKGVSPRLRFLFHVLSGARYGTNALVTRPKSSFSLSDADVRYMFGCRHANSRPERGASSVAPFSPPSSPIEIHRLLRTARSRTRRRHGKISKKVSLTGARVRALSLSDSQAGWAT